MAKKPSPANRDGAYRNTGDRNEVIVRKPTNPARRPWDPEIDSQWPPQGPKATAKESEEGPQGKLVGRPKTKANAKGYDHEDNSPRLDSKYARRSGFTQDPEMVIGMGTIAQSGALDDINGASSAQLEGSILGPGSYHQATGRPWAAHKGRMNTSHYEDEWDE
jgi:hypothetical protein